jgi:hypothetical protein
VKFFFPHRCQYRVFIYLCQVVRKYINNLYSYS